MIVGLTGNIGSGKSTVATIFEKLGAVIYYSDERAKAAYFFESVKPSVLALLGAQAYETPQRINKAYIGQRIFEEANIRQQLQAIIHPAVANDFKAFASQHPKSTLLIKETALLFEAKLENQVEQIILVTAPLALRLQRVMARDGLSAEAVQKKMEAQLPEEEKIKRSHFCICNDEQRLLIPQVINVYEKLQALQNL